MSLDFISDDSLVRSMNNSLVCLLFHGIILFVISRLFINVLIDRSLGCLWILCPMIRLFDRRITHLFVFSFTGFFCD